MMSQTTSPRMLIVASGVLLLGVEAIFLATENHSREPVKFSHIEGNLWMGGHVDLPPLRTRSVLNVCETRDPYNVAFHRWEPIPDTEPGPDLSWLRRMVQFVDEQQRAGRPTYVHCLAGASRSGLVVVAYLMWKHNWTRDRALAFARTKRDIVRPNPAFMRLLMDWEKESAHATSP